MPSPTPAIVVLFGITGDLSRRKLLPALAEMMNGDGQENVRRIIGITRKNDVVIDDLLENIPDASLIRDRIELFSLSEGDEDGYQRLSKRLSVLSKECEDGCQKLFYLSVPPKTVRPIIRLLGSSGLSKDPRAKLLIEKPFGSDLESAKELLAAITDSFTPEKIYRIDHYLAKHLVQKFSSDRQDGIIPQDTWNTDSIERIEIYATESIDIEGRVGFYDETGAVRDLVQSHLLQIAALALMDSTASESVGAARANALKFLRPLPEESIRGHYEGYREEVDRPASMTETFASIVLVSDDPRWKGVTVTLTTGKALAEKQTCIKVIFRSSSEEARIIPLSPADGHEIPDAYYGVFNDAIQGDRKIFVSDDEVTACWNIVDAVLAYWKEHDSPLILYAKGSKVTDVLAKNK